MSCNHENCRLRPDDSVGKCTCGDCGEKVDIDDAINAKLAKVDRFLKEAELRVMAAMYPPAPFVNPFNKPKYGPSALTPPDEAVEVKKGTLPWALAMLMEGKRVKRKGWCDGICLEYNKGFCLRIDNGVFRLQELPGSDATDWQIVEDAQP